MYSLYWLRRSRTSSLRRSSTANSSEMTSAIFSATRSGFDVSMVPGVRLFTSCLEMYETNSLAHSMLLAREFVSYISKQLVKSLTPGTIETSNPDLVAEKIAEVISEELAVEDRLNDEVRDLLSQYSEYMRRESVSYQEMFRRIKNTLISQRKVVKASGRDTGDAMKLSRDKVTDISHKVIEMLRKSRELRLRNKDSNAVRLEIVRLMTEVLMTEDKVDRAARAKIRTQKRDIPEGSEEWDILLRRYYSEELKKLGIDIAGR